MYSELNKKLQNNNIRLTAVRQLVLRMFVENDFALSLSDLEARLDTADRTTLFRTLKTFEKNNIIHTIEIGNGVKKYALCKGNCQEGHHDFHIHFECLHCHHIFCLNNVGVPKLNLPKGFIVNDANVLLKGICLNCSHNIK